MKMSKSKAKQNKKIKSKTLKRVDKTAKTVRAKLLKSPKGKA
jgi:hypothetical protein